ncbi:YqgE/AlgH family protein [Cellulomonas endophytica]|uniref:YqgE/AlgH family protein n=1 Tax=Cellulomonas endophytica TaxID=2494735 RepID=UPI001011D3FF|nr:YqgE/AlgH family protein [Cellulomonas endophytica]
MDEVTESWAGRLLVATPRLEDPPFRRAVVLVLDHGPDGAFGVVVNHPLEVDVSTVLPGWQRFATAPGRLFQGGPVGLDSAIGVAAVPAGRAAPDGVDRIAGAFGLVDLDAEPASLALPGLRIFAGYAGWGPGQLDGEVELGAWWVLDALPDDPFTPAPDDLWSRVVRRQGGDLALRHLWPEDPELN